MAQRQHAARRWRFAALLVVAVLVVGVVGGSLQSQRPLAAPDVATDAGASTGTRRPDGTPRDDASRLVRASHAPRDGEDASTTLADYVLPGETPTMGEVIAALHARGIRTGLGAFNPPGTSPPLEGLEVPDGFPLPEGYVRHQQATDDGQRIAPILMFHPDLTHVDVGGRRVPVPADRVVPPELAPPGMPLRRVRIPPPRSPGP